MNKEKSLVIRLDGDLRDQYKKMCEKNGFNMSKKIRTFIESELAKFGGILNIEDEVKEFVNDTIAKDYDAPFRFDGVELYFFNIWNVRMFNGDKLILAEDIGGSDFHKELDKIGKRHNVIISFPRKDD
tara:strand:+ start:20222 stop:20605 length:384 start_codon:yes stop_codon:yes gene_type:complete